LIRLPEKTCPWKRWDFRWWNTEGFVIKFASGYRIKVKLAEYLRLHRILTKVSSRTIWEHLRTGTPLDQILDEVPDEFYQWVRETENRLRSDYATVAQEAAAHYQQLVRQLGDNYSRKDFAQLARQYHHPHGAEL
jgi:RNA ligase